MFALIVRKLVRMFGLVSGLPFRLRKPLISTPEKTAHRDWEKELSEAFNHNGMRILEVGSRNVGGRPLRGLFSNADYVGFDYHSGDNVDLVGDAHKLSSYFEAGEKFDLIFCSAVFEHLAMPWRVAEEFSKLLRVGGRVFVETHFSFSAHERPWNFFQFSENGLEVLFNTELGFRTLDKGMCNPINGFFDSRSSKYLRYRPVTELYCHSSIYVEKDSEPVKFDWRSLDVHKLTATKYPLPEEVQRSPFAKYV